LVDDEARGKVVKVLIPEDVNGLSVDMMGGGYRTSWYCERGVSVGFTANEIPVVKPGLMLLVGEGTSIPGGVPVAWENGRDGES
jgi:hypothetical protein